MIGPGQAVPAASWREGAGVGRREIAVDPNTGALAWFAADLRELRRAAGSPSYRELAARAHYSHNTLSMAASGRTLPSRAVALAFVAACGGDLAAWQERWQQLEHELAAAVPGEPAAVAARAAPVPRQLPGAPPCFVGRGTELAILDSQFPGGAGSPGAPVPLLLICGGGGIGKTNLALHWGHRHPDLFPGGQLFADLRGFDPVEQPLPAATVLRGFLRALGVPDAAIPREEDAAAALYRSVLSGRRVLVVLDNAASTGQVAPLLPGDSGCAVLVTSRRRLPALTARFGARTLKLGTMASSEARDMLSRLLGTQRLADAAGAVDDVIRYCDGMPLALAIFAARAGGYPDIPLQDLAAELRADMTRLDMLEPGERGLGLRAVFSCSARALSLDAAGLLALLALAPGADISVSGAASLAGSPLPRARSLLRELEDADLVNRRGDRHRMHDLVRLFALECAEHFPTELDREAALTRLADFYLHTASYASQRLHPPRHSIDVGQPADGVCLLKPRDHAEALGWIDAEYGNLLAIHRWAVTDGRHALVWQLAWLLKTYRVRRGLIRDQFAAWTDALANAGRVEPRTASLIHEGYGAACAWMERHDEAVAHLSRGLALAKEQGDQLGQAYCHFGLVHAHHGAGDCLSALRHATRAAELYRDADNPTWQALVLCDSTHCAVQVSRHDLARAHIQLALTLARRHQLPDGQASALTGLGQLAVQAGNPGEALLLLHSALTLFRAMGNAYFGATTLEHLGRAHADLGQPEQARDAWNEALQLYRAQCRRGDTDRVTAQLHALNAAPCASDAAAGVAVKDAAITR
jgi:tetratricopeptide (TPR) repeat protein